MSLRSCVSCGATLTDMFRFCPACGLSDDDSGWGAEPKAPLSFPIVERASRSPRASNQTWWTRVVRSAAGVRVPTPPTVPRRLVRRVSVFPRRVAMRVGRVLAALGEAAGLIGEVVVLGAGSVRDALRSMVLVRKLHAQRAAVIYSTGCAALSGDDRRVRHARAEVQMLDELFSAAATGALYDLPVSGEDLRRSFEEKLERRELEDDAVSGTA